MKQLQLTLIAVLFSSNIFAITHAKSVDPVVISTNLSKEQVWQRLVGLFVGNSIPIKLMDKSTGLIQSERLGLGRHYALQHADDSLAWALCETVKSPEGDSFYLFPQIINGELQVYVQEMVDGKTLLSVNLTNLNAIQRDPYLGLDKRWLIESTKRLETRLAQYLTSYEPMPTLIFDDPLATFGEAPSQIARREAASLERAKYYQELLKLDNEKWEKEREEKALLEKKEKWKQPFIWLGAVIIVAAMTGFFWLIDPNK